MQSLYFSIPGHESQHALELPKMVSVVEEETIRNPSRPKPQLVVDAFYENLYPGSRSGKLRASFESYAAFRNDSSVDEMTLKQIKKHYKNAFAKDMSEEDELDWPVLKDHLVNLVVAEDCSLGLSLILTEMRQREPVVAQEILDDPRMTQFVLYLASLDALLKRLGEKTFHVPSGLLYASAKSLSSKNCLDSELFDSALTIAEVEME
jgi:hypothetical protein